ncbi:hypothetical protein AKO1_007738 [Acrasis kona]|uniref:Uncharacterized protein n=1 Tax=Acrasis kona TaxID=1008807 RepID=A0AAW2YQA0_9EUKA
MIMYFTPVFSEKCICDFDICTWWHRDFEINTKNPVGPHNVRRSRRYNVQVAKHSTKDFYDSFVYESIPRNGNGRIQNPWDLPHSDTLDPNIDDGISIEEAEQINLSWSQFVYNRDVDVKISHVDGISLGPISNIIIRPSHLVYNVSINEGSVIIHIPKDDKGHKFSIEFKDDLYSYCSNRFKYVKNGDLVGLEPRNGLLIFASPPLTRNMVPDMNATNTHVMKPGPINNNDLGSSEIIYFPPGVYWVNQVDKQDDVYGKYGQNHIKLHPNTYWVYFGAGSYVKGAIEYTTQNKNFYATGFGVLSGEHYVYQANIQLNYSAVKSDQFSLRMWSHNSIKRGQMWFCVGPTISSPPFNTLDFRPSDSSLTISDYKQVGSYFYQTNGPQIYSGSVIRDVFYHVNDDAIKTYYSNVLVERVIVWKCHNDPVVQMGWSWRNISNVTVDSLFVIHTRYFKSETFVPSAIIGASPFYSPDQKVRPEASVSVTFSNLICEGLCPSLVRIVPLQSYNNLLILNASFPDGLMRNDIGRSIVSKQKNIKMGIKIMNWFIAGEKVTMSNFKTDSLGRFDIDSSYWGQWSIN